MWITSTHKHYIAGMRKTLNTIYFYLTPSYSRSHILLTSNYWKNISRWSPPGAGAKTVQPQKSTIQESMWLAAGWLQSIIVCCVSLEHSTGGDTMLILPARWLESASLRILGHFLPPAPPCVTNNGQVKHSPPPPPWGHLAPSTVSTPGVSSWNIEIVGISSSPVQTYLCLFLSLSYVISKVP